MFSPPDEEYAEDVYAYNRGPSDRPAPLVGDLRVLAEVTFHGGEGAMRWELLRDGTRFHAEICRDGQMTLSMSPAARPDEVTVLDQNRGRPFAADRPYVIEFGHLDYRAYVCVNGETALTSNDENYRPDLEQLRTFSRIVPVRVRLAAGNLDLAFAWSASRPRRLLHLPQHVHAARLPRPFVCAERR